VKNDGEILHCVQHDRAWIGGKPWLREGWKRKYFCSDEKHPPSQSATPFAYEQGSAKGDSAVRKRLKRTARPVACGGARPIKSSNNLYYQQLFNSFIQFIFIGFIYF